MQVFRVTARPKPDSDWSDDPYDWVKRIFELDEQLRASGRAMTLECGIELPRVDGLEASRIRVVCEDFGHAVIWLSKLLLGGCVVDYILTIDNYRPLSVPSNWVARP